MSTDKITVAQIFDFINEIAPFGSQESWDNSGILVGNRNSEVTSVAVCLDVTNDTVSQAVNVGANLIVSHHPVIWNPLKSIDFDMPVGKAIKNGISVISAHTNWDLAIGGVNDVLAKLVGLEDIHAPAVEGELAMLRVGTLKSPVPASSFADIVADTLDTVVRLTLPEKQVKTIAVCGGSGASFLPELATLDVDAFLTGDAKHNDYLDSIDLDVSLLAAGHYETETVSMPVLMEIMRQEFPDLLYTYLESSPVVYAEGFNF